jgi:hypothetical protein
MERVKRPKTNKHDEITTIHVKTERYDRDFILEDGKIVKMQWANVLIGHEKGQDLYIKKGRKYEFLRKERGEPIYEMQLVPKKSWSIEEFKNTQMWDGYLHKGKNRRKIIEELMK